MAVAPKEDSPSYQLKVALWKGPTAQANDVRFGSKADMCSAKGDVRFTPNSDRESGFPQQATSALPPKADMCSALAHVCFGPKADIRSIQ